MHEAEFEMKVTAYVVKGFDVIAPEVNKFRNYGVYRLYFRDGGCVFAEFMSDTGRMTPRQVDIHEMMRSVGFNVLILSPNEGVPRAAELIHRAFFGE